MQRWLNERLPILALLGWLLIGGLIATAQGADVGSQTYAVGQTFNKQPFEYQVTKLEDRAGYRILHLTFPSPVKTAHPANNTVPAEYYLPTETSAEKKRPAVLVLHILNGNFELERLLCISLATRGIPAVMIKLPYYGERALPGGRNELLKRPDLFLEALPQGILDARRTIDLLASRTEIDPEKIGVAGISLGGMVSATTAGSDKRVHRAALLLAGGDLLSIIHQSREGASIAEFLKSRTADERKKFETAIHEFDPITHAAELRERAQAGRVLMINAAADEVVSPANTRKLGDALGMTDKIQWNAGLGHYTAIAALPQSFATTVDFFAKDLPPGTETKPTTTAGTPAEIFASIGQDLIRVISVPPDPGRCHMLDLSAKFTDKGGKKYEGQVRLIRGDGSKFRMEFKIDQLGEGAWGCDDSPWVASATQVYRGEKQTGQAAGDPWKYCDPAQANKLSLVAYGVASLLSLPGLVDQTLDVHEESKGDEKAFLVRLKDRKIADEYVRITLNRDQRPARLIMQQRGSQAEINFNTWQINTIAPEEIFQPPAKKTVKHVPVDDLRKIFAATFEFLMDQVP